MFVRFWGWFGRIVHKIRHQKAFASLWLNGLIYGFLSKIQAEEILKGESAGTFLIRFSERVPGKQAIAYVKENRDTNQTEVRHYLIAPHEKKGKVLKCDL